MAASHSPEFVKLCEKARARITEISTTDLLARSGAAPLHLVDVREDHEWLKGHLPGAVHLGKGIIERDIESRIPDTDAEIVLYCGGGYRSALAACAFCLWLILPWHPAYLELQQASLILSILCWLWLVWAWARHVLGEWPAPIWGHWIVGTLLWILPLCGILALVLG